MKRLRGIGLGILIFLAAEAIQYVIVFGLNILYGIFIGSQLILKKGPEGMSDPAKYTEAVNQAVSGNMIYTVSVFAVIVCGAAFFLWYRHEIRWEPRGSLYQILTLKNIPLIIFLGIGCQFFVTGIMNLTQKYFGQLFTDYANQIDRLTSGNIILVLFLMTIIAPITEELVFRGMILHMSNRFLTFWGANILQAMLFGVYHQNIIQGIYAAALGLLLGIVYRKFRSIFASIFLHMVINTSSFLVLLFPDNSMGSIILTAMGGI
jgi:membrane protease YdiL (CAAX protease family)